MLCCILTHYALVKMNVQKIKIRKLAFTDIYWPSPLEHLDIKNKPEMVNAPEGLNKVILRQMMRL